GQGGRGGRVVTGLPLHDAQLGEGVGLTEPVAGPVRRGQGGPVEGGGLVPVTAGLQEAAHRDGQGGRRRQGRAGGGGLHGGVQDGGLGFQPGGRVPEGGHSGGQGWRAAGRRAAVGAGPGGEVPASGQGGVQVVIQQPPGCLVGFGGICGGGQGA